MKKMSHSKTAIVTGGTSGIGFAVAVRLLADGFAVHIWGRDEVRGRRAAESLAAGDGSGNVTFVRCDVRSIDQIAAAVGTFSRHHQHLDLLVNCAGILRREPLSQVQNESVDEQIDTLLKGPILITGAVSELLACSHGGVIANIGSAAGKEPFPLLGVYGAAKAGLAQFTRSVAKELYLCGVRAFCVNPGVVETDLMSAAELAQLRTTLPGRRFQSAEEVADLVVHLASGPYAALNGAVVEFDDGVSLFTGILPADKGDSRGGGSHVSDERTRRTTASAVPGGNGADGFGSAAVLSTPDKATEQLSEELASVFGEVFAVAPDAIHENLSPDNVSKWDSIGHVRLVAALEEKLPCSFNVDEIMQLTSFGEILSILKGKMS
jgi:3-oxoacyl-[acyl-carrier protein] reductase